MISNQANRNKKTNIYGNKQELKEIREKKLTRYESKCLLDTKNNILLSN